MAVATASKTRKSGKRYGYLDVMAQASKPLESRREMKIGRGGTLVKPRKFHLSDEEIADLRKLHEDGDKMPNPQNRGSYWYIIEAIKSLGLNRKHPLKELIVKVRDLMNDKETKDEDGKTAWARFRDKEAATDNADNALKAEDRIYQNITVLQRVNVETTTTPYGLKLLQVGQKVLKTAGCVIDVLKGATDKEILVRLNTDSAVPTNEMKRQRGTGDEKPAKVARAAKPKTVKSDHPASDKVTPAAAPASDAPSAVAASEPTSDIPETV